jgi:hypothetical protein
MYLAFLCIGLIILYFVFYFIRQNHKEGFDNHDPNYGNFYELNDIYDDFYSFMQDNLFYNEQYYKNICQIILKYLNNVYNNHLCIGIKHSGHINELLRNNMNTLSVSTSKSIVELCKYKYSENNYQFVDSLVKSPYIFNDHQFTHISIIDNEIYYHPELYTLFNNCSKWIIHKGYLFLQLYNDVNSMENGFEKLNYETNVPIEYNYTSNFKKMSSNHHYYFIEIMKHKDKIRKNTHSLYFYDSEFITRILNELDFQYVNKYEVNDFEQLWVFQKH